MSSFDVAVVGGGVVGLATATALARLGWRVAVIEREARPGTQISARNSQVIHAGIYYPRDSEKATLCVEGRELLYERCARLGIGHRRLGKLIVATDESEISVLEGLQVGGDANGAGPLRLLDRRDVSRREPRVRAMAGLWSPRTGIVDTHALVESYVAELQSLGASLVCRTEVRGLCKRGAIWGVETTGADGARFDLEVPFVVNAAGLASDRLAAMAGLDVDALGWRLFACKGDYFSVAPSLGPLTTHLVYPVPTSTGLGIHITLDLTGQYRLGPDTEYLDEPSYRVDPAKAEKFARAVQRYFPEIGAQDLAPDFAGIRPKLTAPGQGFGDFVIEESSSRGAAGMVNLIGIDSPGLTSSAAIARRVAGLLGGRDART